MRWPWTSVARLEDRDREIVRLSGEITWLRGRLEDMERQTERRRRVEMGLAELPREERVKRQDMPTDLVRHINRWKDPTIRKMQLHAAFKRNANGETWESIMSDIMQGRQPDLQEAASG